MKTNRTAKRTALGLLSCMALGFAAGTSIGATISAPLDGSTLQELNSSTLPEASYGPPPAASFYDGPTFASSGDAASFYAGPPRGQLDIESLLFVFSMNALPVDPVDFVLNVGGESMLASFSASDFLSTADCGFGFVDGLGDGKVNGIAFPDAYHAAARLGLSLGVDQGTELGSIEVTTSSNLRIDIFGIARRTAAASAPAEGYTGKKRIVEAAGGPVPYAYRIANNAANSGAVGYRVPDGGTTVLLLGGAIMVLGAMKRVRFS